MKKNFALTVAAIVTYSMAFGSSFQLNLQSIRQTAMGGSGVAWPWDASTIFFGNYISVGTMKISKMIITSKLLGSNSNISDDILFITIPPPLCVL